MNPTMVRQLANAQLVALRAQAERDRMARAASRALRARQYPGPRWSAAILARLARRGKSTGDGRSPAQNTIVPKRKATPAAGME